MKFARAPEPLKILSSCLTLQGCDGLPAGLDLQHGKYQWMKRSHVFHLQSCLHARFRNISHNLSR